MGRVKSYYWEEIEAQECEEYEIYYDDGSFGTVDWYRSGVQQDSRTTAQGGVDSDQDGSRRVGSPSSSSA